MKHSYAPEWSYEETLKRILAVPDPHFRQFFTILYVCGARINEGRGILTKDVVMGRNSFNHQRLYITVPTEKNPHQEKRTLAINPYGESEYFNIIKEWRKLPETKRNPKPFQTYSTRWYQYMAKKYMGIHSHALRHLRVHHIDDKTVPKMKGFTPKQYKDYFGWSMISTSAQYQSRTTAQNFADNL